MHDLLPYKDERGRIMIVFVGKLLVLDEFSIFSSFGRVSAAI
jgi:hypothetical protein